MPEEKIELDFDFEILENMSGVPDVVKASIKKGDMVLRIPSLTTDFLPEKWLVELAKDSLNNRVLWRHKDPELGGRYYGRNLVSTVTDGIGDNAGKKVIDSYYRIFGGEEGTYNDKLQKYIKLKNEHGHPIGISKGFIINRCPKNGEIQRVFALEDSITYRPKCKTCLTTEVFQMDEKDLKHKEKEIKELQDELDSAKLQLEEKVNASEEMEAKIAKFEADINEKEAEKKTLEDKLIDVSDSLKKLEDKLIQQERAPHIAKLKDLEKSKVVFEVFKNRPLEEIQKRVLELEQAKAGPQVITTTLDEEARTALEGEDGEKPKEIGIEGFRNNPPLAREIAEMRKNDSELDIKDVWIY